MRILEVEQNSDEWHVFRLGIPTASDFGKLLTGTGKPSAQIGDYAAHLAAEKYAGEPIGTWGGSRATQRGNELEPEARDLYVFQRDAEVTEVGFCISSKFAGFEHAEAGCSPDGLVKEPGRGKWPGLLEIKALSASKHVLARAYYTKNKRPPPDYVAQCQGQMLITGRRWCDLYFYHPQLPELAIRISRDDKYCALLVAQINAAAARRDELLELLEAA